MPTSRLPPASAVGVRYDGFLQRALRRFFERAIFESEPVDSEAAEGRLTIEPGTDPSVMSALWYGRRYRLRVPEGRPFTDNERRTARAIGAVLSARVEAILNPGGMIEQGDLFRGAIEDRYIGAFFDPTHYELPVPAPMVDRVVEVIDVLRMAALSTYENRPISTGVLLLGTDYDPVSPPEVAATGPYYSQALTSIKSFFRLADGQHTVFLTGRDGRLLSIVDVDRWATQVAQGATLAVPCGADYRAHARATLLGGHVAVVLSPQREIKVFAGGEQVFAFRNAHWHLLDLSAKYQLWERAVGDRALARRLFQTALDLSDARDGALFVVLRRPLESLGTLVTPSDRLDMEPVPASGNDSGLERRHLFHLFAGRTATDLDESVLASLATLDGAVVCDPHGQLLAVGAFLRHPVPASADARVETEGARTTAALAASQAGPVLKVSEDGMITFFDQGRVWDI